MTALILAAVLVGFGPVQPSPDPVQVQYVPLEQLLEETHHHHPEPEPEPEPEVHTHAHDPVWDRLAECESHGDWHTNTGNGYYGGLQFNERSWQWVGGSGFPHEHSKEEQIKRAEILLARQGWGAWPACSRKLGLR